jgi:hypothetical protein
MAGYKGVPEMTISQTSASGFTLTEVSVLVRLTAFTPMCAMLRVLGVAVVAAMVLDELLFTGKDAGRRSVRCRDSFGNEIVVVMMINDNQ